MIYNIITLIYRRKILCCIINFKDFPVFPRQLSSAIRYYCERVDFTSHSFPHSWLYRIPAIIAIRKLLVFIPQVIAMERLGNTRYSFMITAWLHIYKLALSDYNACINSTPECMAHLEEYDA